MLEVSHLSKIYKGKKGGADVRALDDVSVSFPETGMVFLLGKSGSGKSTLLNVCGGLDEPTSGEIIVKGRSSKDFNQSDFDSYRNTFVGFIFQEYNILNEFTVEDNIALALELQNKPKDKKAIAELLERVDLTGFAKRKPNTLSGGQKQRIAIARALIKSPEIIMADEPTGALDSATGTQVLDTLKKLSKDTLVIVVSHDREFAETYGDRIIELKDGKIISDISKVNKEQEQISKNVNLIGDTLCIKKGAKLDSKDLKEIEEFIQNTDSDILIAKGEKDVKAFKKASKINEKGEKEVFENTESSNIKLKTYKKEDSKFIRSKLPLRHAFKIGVSSLKSKPIRLFFTIVLCTISFAMFGLLSTMTFYDNESTFKETLRTSDYSLIKLNKEYKSQDTSYAYGKEDWSYTSTNETRFTEQEFKEYVNKYGKDTFTGVNVSMRFNVQSMQSAYWVNEVTTFAYISEDNSLRSRITGNYPTNSDEICISSYLANVIFNNKIVDGKTNKVLNLKDVNDIIGKNITLGYDTYKVVGIIDSGELDSKYDNLLNTNEIDYGLQGEFMSILQDELHLMVFVTENELKDVAYNNPPYTNNEELYSHRITTDLKQGDYQFDEYANASYSVYLDKYDSNLISLFGDKELDKNEAVVCFRMFAQLMMDYYSSKGDYGDYNAWNKYELANQVYNKGIYNEDGFKAFSEKELKEKINSLINEYKKENRKLYIGYKLFDDYNQVALSDVAEVQIIGVLDTSITQNMDNIVFFREDKAKELWDVQKINLPYYTESDTKYEYINTMYGTIYLPFDHSETSIQNLWNIYEHKEYKEDDSKVNVTSYMIYNLEMVDMTIEELSNVFLYAGIVFAVFSILLFSNFISVSISNKKKEIGILRAVGARSIDVFKIFFSESFVITAVCVVLSIIGSMFISNMLNETLSIGIGVAIFVFGILSILVLIGIAILTCVLATLIPVYNAAKKKPVDSIRAI